MTADLDQMRHIADRVGELFFRQRSPRPVREAGRLVDMRARDALYQLIVGDLVAIAQGGGSDLRVEDRVRHGARILEHDLQVLPRGMEDLHHVRVCHQRVERREIDVRSEGVDDRRLLVRRDLNEAKLGVVCGLAQELRVHGDKGRARQALAQHRKGLRGGYGFQVLERAGERLLAWAHGSAVGA